MLMTDVDLSGPPPPDRDAELGMATQTPILDPPPSSSPKGSPPGSDGVHAALPSDSPSRAPHHRPKEQPSTLLMAASPLHGGHGSSSSSNSNGGGGSSNGGGGQGGGSEDGDSDKRLLDPAPMSLADALLGARRTGGSGLAWYQQPWNVG